MNRRTLLLAGLATLPAAALPAPIIARRGGTHWQRTSAGPARHRRGGGLVAGHVRTRVITRTFTSLVPITIPVEAAIGRPYPSTIQVSGFNQGRIRTVRVTLLGFGHDFPEDLDILLAAPGNVGVMIMSDAGGGAVLGVSGLTLTFDQDAADPPPTPLVSGTFQPVNLGSSVDVLAPPAPAGVSGHALSRFTNRNPNGTWRLFIQDDTPGLDGGSLAGWRLQIQARVRVPHRHPRRRRRS